MSVVDSSALPVISGNTTSEPVSELAVFSGNVTPDSLVTSPASVFFVPRAIKSSVRNKKGPHQQPLLSVIT
ncbi:TPA: hypothetical protein JDD40_002286 [Salmonella enterica subsp. diarizonae]|nr:hypothetical protein [Salmonella enterica subsp. diarizonae]